MNRNFKLTFWIFFLLALLALLVMRLSGQEILLSRNIEVQSASLGTIVQVQQSWTLLEKVEECKGLLKNSPKLEFVEKIRSLVKKQIELCILNIETGELTNPRYWLDEKDVDRAEILRKKHLPNPNNLPRFMPVDLNEEFEVTTNWWNNWASNLEVEKMGSASNDIYVIAGNKFLVPNAYVKYSEDRTGSKYSDIIFISPYSEGMHDSEVVRKGAEFINQKVDLAFEDLRNRQVMSLSFPGQLVVDTISKTFVKNILMVEQTDPDAILNKAKTDDERRRVVEKVLLRYGLNGEKSYRYTVSKAGAAGPAQIMASTGQLIFKIFGAANLLKDINIGRLDMHNATKTETLVFDHHLSEVKARVNRSGLRAKNIFAGLSEDLLDEVRGMAYNGGPSKYNVSTGGLNLRARGAKETKLFLEKLRVIRELKLFD